jgi:hypothetical protein
MTIMARRHLGAVAPNKFADEACPTQNYAIFVRFGGIMILFSIIVDRFVSQFRGLHNKGSPPSVVDGFFRVRL